MSGVSLHGGLAHRKASTYTREFTSQTNIPRRNIKYITCRRLVRLEDKARVRVSNSGRGKGFFFYLFLLKSRPALKLAPNHLSTGTGVPPPGGKAPGMKFTTHFHLASFYNSHIPSWRGDTFFLPSPLGSRIGIL